MADNNAKRRFLIVLWDSPNRPTRKDFISGDFYPKMKIYFGDDIHNNPILASVIIPLIQDGGYDKPYAVIEIFNDGDLVRVRFQLNERLRRGTAYIPSELEQKLICDIAKIHCLQLPLLDIEKSITRHSTHKRKILSALVETRANYPAIRDTTISLQQVITDTIDGEIRDAIGDAINNVNEIDNAISSFLNIAYPVVYWDHHINDTHKKEINRALRRRYIPISISNTLERLNAKTTANESTDSDK